jgi:hypothetical protein
MKKEFKLALSVLVALGIGRGVSAHSLAGPPILPTKHAVSLTTKLLVPHVTASHAQSLVLSRSLTSLLDKHGLTSFFALNRSFLGPGSLGFKTYSQFERNLVINGVKLGQSTVQIPAITNGGTITGGTLQGTLYINLGSGEWGNEGEFTGTLGQNIPVTFDVNTNVNTVLFGLGNTTPGFQNTINLQNTPTILVKSKGTGVGVPFITGRSGSARAFDSLVTGLTGRSINLGQQLALAKASGPVLPSSVLSGFISGTAYRNSLGSSAFVASRLYNLSNTQYVFVFGNNPLNIPALRSMVQFFTPSANTITFANGVTEPLTSGQILFPQFGALFPSFPPPFTNQNAIFFTFGSNPANNGTIGSVLGNLNSYLFF